MTQRAHRRYMIDEPASPAATQRLFGISDARAAVLARYVTEALESTEPAQPGEAAQARPPSRARKAT